MFSKDRLAWVGVALALLIPAFFAATRELGAISERGSSEIARYQAAREGGAPDPLSFTGVQQNLLDCMEMADGIYGRLQFDGVSQEMAATCRGLAKDAMQSNPHYGFAALVAARMAAIDKDWPKFNKMLVLSQQGSASEQWISVERLKLYVKHEAELDPETLPARSADIDLLLESPVGIKSIASLYINSEHLRTLIAEQAERLPEHIQARFLGTLKAILKG